MVELLKQPQYSPYTLSDQVVSIFTGVQGYLDDLTLNQVLSFEKAMLRHVHDEHPEVFQEIAETGELSDPCAERLREIFKEFAARYQDSGA